MLWCVDLWSGGKKGKHTASPTYLRPWRVLHPVHKEERHRVIRWRGRGEIGLPLASNVRLTISFDSRRLYTFCQINRAIKQRNQVGYWAIKGVLPENNVQYS